MLVAAVNHGPPRLLHKFLKCPLKTPRASQNPLCSSLTLPPSGWYQIKLGHWGNTPQETGSGITRARSLFLGGFPRNKCPSPEFCPLGPQKKKKRAERRMQQPGRRRRGSKGGCWGSQSLKPRLQTASGSCSCSPNVNSHLLLKQAPAGFRC